MYENIRKIATGQGDDYATGCLSDYIYFKNYYKMIVVDLSKLQALAIQEINFTANLERAGNTRIYFILDTRLFTRNCKSFVSAILLSATSLNNLIFINIK